MRNFYFVVALFILIFSQSLMANMKESASCQVVAKACKSAGFDKNNKFWKNCMKPLLYGQNVKDVTVDPKEVAACRADKIAKMEKEIAELKNVK